MKAHECFIQAGAAAQRAVDRVIERAELVRLCRDRGRYVRDLAGAALQDAAWRKEWEVACDAHGRARRALDEFDHAGRAP